MSIVLTVNQIDLGKFNVFTTSTNQKHDVLKQKLLDATLLLGTAPIVGHRGNVANALHPDSGSLQRTNGLLTTRARPFNDDIYLLHAALLRRTRRKGVL